MSQVRQLLDLISKNVDLLESTCAQDKTNIPTLEDPFLPGSDAFRSNPAAADAAGIISAAAAQLVATLRPAPAQVMNMVGAYLGSTSLRMCIESHVTEILREAGPKGLHVEQIAAKTGVDAQKLARCLRYLATRHMYSELQPDVFTNNRISSVLDTGRSSAEIIADPINKYENTSGLAALAGMTLDEGFKSGSYHWEVAGDPKTAKSGDPSTAPFARAVGDGKSYWEYMAQPQNNLRSNRFDVGMKSLRATQTICSAFDWKSLPENALVVDVGGGIGSASMVLARHFPNLKFVVQDITPVEHGVQIWKQEMPDALESGRVKFEAHDFFMPQPQTDASVFLLKNVLHDWSDEYCSTILKHLREAAMPYTRLLIGDRIMPYACHDPLYDVADGIPGAASHEAPAPLLANWGIVNANLYDVDISMMTLFNGQERTVAQFDQLLKSTGWQIKTIRRLTGAGSSPSIEAVPQTFVELGDRLLGFGPR